jgi:hypothetical protein
MGCVSEKISGFGLRWKFSDKRRTGMERIRTGVSIALALFVACIVGCGGGTKTVKIEQNAEQGMAVSLPEAYEMNYARDTTAIYGKGTALSSDMQTSIDKANTIASAELAGFLERKVESYRTYLVREESGSNQADLNFQSATKMIVSQALQGTEEHFRKIYKEDGKYRAYLVLKLPVGRANKALLDQIKKDERTWQMYKDEKQLKALDENVLRYEEWKKNQ